MTNDTIELLEFAKARSFARRNAGKRQKAGWLTNLRENTIATKEPGEVAGLSCSLGEDIFPAGWKVRMRTQHEIQVHKNAVTLLHESVRDSEPLRNKLIKALIRHECAHGLWSDKDQDDIGRICADKKIPYRLMNLFEDIRVEHKERERAKGNGEGHGRFGWSKLWDLPASTNDASEYLYIMGDREASSFKNLSSGCPRWHGVVYTSGMQTHLRVRWYYERIVDTPTQRDLIPLLEQWVKEFGGTPKQFPRVADRIAEHGTGSFKGGHGMGADDANEWGEKDREAATEFEVDAGTADPTPQEAKSLETFERSNFYCTDYGWQATRPTAIKRLTDKLSGMARRAGVSATRTSQQGSRIHVPNVAVGNSNSFRSMKVDSGRRCLTLVVDMSGSMTDYNAGRHALEFVRALRNLQKRGLLHSRIFLTGGGKHVELKHEWSDKRMEMLAPCCNRESVMQTLSAPKVRQAMDSSSATVVYTDAMLTDGDIDTNYWRSQGVDLIGAVASSNEAATQGFRKRMDEHFAKSFVTQEPVQLATEIVNYITRK